MKKGKKKREALLKIGAELVRLRQGKGAFFPASRKHQFRGFLSSRVYFILPSVKHCVNISFIN